MRAIQAHLNQDSRRGLILAIASLCLVLLALLSVAQVAHLHSDGADADHCPLCIVMHTAVPVVAAAAVVVLVHIGASAPIAEPRLIARQSHFQLFIRPPPIAC